LFRFEFVSSSLTLSILLMMFSFNYFSILLFLIFSIILSTIIFFLSFFLSSKLDDAEKLTAYECGFNPFSDSRSEFDVKFYIVAILFIIFDLEISFLFPFSVCLNTISISGVYFMLLFLIILTIGFFYEWKKGALDWD
jgi:NADH-quinone oxidoreductase subunit A